MFSYTWTSLTLECFNSEVAECSPFAQKHHLFFTLDQSELLHVWCKVNECCTWKHLPDSFIVLEGHCTDDTYLTLNEPSFLQVVCCGGSDVNSSPTDVCDRGYPTCVWEVV